MIRTILILLLLCSCATQNGATSYKRNKYTYTKSKPNSRSKSNFNRRYYSGEIIGNPAERVSNTIGEPELKRFDYPSEIWLYPREEGTLFIFFEQTDKGNVAKYIEARDNTHDNLLNTDAFIKRNF